MVSIAPNGILLKGEVESIHEHPAKPAYSIVALKVKSTKKLPQLNNLFDLYPGDQIEAMVLTDALHGQEIGIKDEISCQLSKTSSLANFINPESVKKEKTAARHS